MCYHTNNVACVVMLMSGVRLVLHGISRVHWDEERAYTKGSSSKMSHKNVDVYLDEMVMLVSKC